jgi:hypothetical protein
MEADLFSNHCTIPVAARVVTGVLFLLFTPWIILSELYLHRSRFFQYDPEKRAIITLRVLCFSSAAYLVGPTGYDRKWSDKGGVDQQLAWTLASAGCAFDVLARYRTLRRVVSSAFVLRSDLVDVLRRLTYVEITHTVLWMTVISNSIWKAGGSHSDEHRLQVIVCALAFFAPWLLLPWPLLHLISRSLRSLPKNIQSESIRRELLNVRSYVKREAVILLISMVFPVAILLYGEKIMVLLMSIAYLCFMLPVVLGNVLKVSKQILSKKASTSDKRISPMASKPLSEWEEHGRCSEPINSLPSAVVEAGVAGVSWECIRQFAEENEIPQGWTMAQLCANAIKPKTNFACSIEARRFSLEQQKEPVQVHCSYAALIGKARDGQGRAYVAAPTHFFSYAWSYPWSVVFSAIGALEQEAEEGAATGGAAGGGQSQFYYFIDQFCLDQHVMTSGAAMLSKEEMQAEIVAKLRHSIEVPGRVLMLLHPYDKPVVLQRAWCLFEIFTAILADASVEMCFAPNEEGQFFAALRGGSFNAKAVCSTVDAIEATATEKDDKEMILESITRKVGLREYNEQLRQFLVEQYSLVAMRGERSSKRRSNKHVSGGGTLGSTEGEQPALGGQSESSGIDIDTVEELDRWQSQHETW